MTTFYTTIDSPLGKVLLAKNDDGLVLINLQGGTTAKSPEADWLLRPEMFATEIAQFQAYFAGELQSFSLSLAPQGTLFQQKVWQALQEIPYGETISYGTLANQIGQPKAARAVGLANAKNPLPIVVPCHRVVGSNGKLTGYAGGLHFKEALLALEQGI